ncbi:HVO_2753 family zinc finger protein [Halococcus agarilyticus]|uniref:HVO_2753 family zinc finger protein n=1 Tax=Halococcus agarilyticus TaxID=1232219 RepID=UPI000677CCE1|nr:HVO_2753 family zinc finger protein [Halococcus agarilyticus]
MSESEQQASATRSCVSCGINISGTNAAAFDCPECGTQIYRCATCRKQSNLYECPDCGFTGP